MSELLKIKEVLGVAFLCCSNNLYLDLGFQCPILGQLFNMPIVRVDLCLEDLVPSSQSLLFQSIVYLVDKQNFTDISRSRVSLHYSGDSLRTGRGLVNWHLCI